MTERRTLNVNVGVTGHVDSGKTSLVAALSTTLSTAALDKHPQSRERGITLDLGFSSFFVPAPERIRAAGYDSVQFTLVDCPGHASLIRTIIGGAQIIDLMLLVVDVTKGIQPQTAECIVISETTVASGDLVVALNKTDLLPPEKRERYVRKAHKLVAQTLASTKFAGAQQVAVAVRPGAAAQQAPMKAGDTAGSSMGASGAATDCSASSSGEAAAGAVLPPQGVQGVVEALLSRVRLRPPAAGSDPFLFYVDHCFAIKGQGTVLTGTVVRGSVHVGDALELPQLRQQRKVKGIQVFRRPVAAAGPGDRAGLCVTQLSAKLVERGLACSPGSVPTFSAAVAAVEKIRFFSGEVRSHSRMHITVGPDTVMAELLFFGLPDGEGTPTLAALEGLAAHVGRLGLDGPSSSLAAAAADAAAPDIDLQRDYLYQEELYGMEGRPPASAAGPVSSSGASAGDQQQQQQHRHYGPQWCYLRFTKPVTAPQDSLIIGSRLDADAHGGSCRLAFYGRLCLVSSNDGPAVAGAGGDASGHSQRKPQPPQPPGTLQAALDDLQRRLRIFKPKRREGVIERIEADGRTAICRGMFHKETDLSVFSGMKVVSGCGQQGVIEGSFGRSGKFRVAFRGAVAALLPDSRPNYIVLIFRKQLFDADRRRMVQ